MIFILLSLLLSEFSDAGAIFLTIAPGAKAVSMGSAFTALADDATCVYYNPAALGSVGETQVCYMNMAFPWSPARGLLEVTRHALDTFLDMPDGLEPPWLTGLYPGMRHTYFGLVNPLGDRAGVSLAFTHLSTGLTQVVDPVGNPIGEFETYDYALSVSYGQRISRQASFGGSVKYIRSFLWPEWVGREVGYEGRGYAHSIAFDLGFLYRTPLPLAGHSIGLSLQNIGPELDYGDDQEELPRLLRLGMAVDPIAMVDSFAVRVNRPVLSKYLRYTYSRDMVMDLVGRSHDAWHCTGHEITVLNRISYRWGTFEDREGLRVGSTKGYGLNLGLLDFEIATDEDIYSFPTENWRVQVDIAPHRFSNFQHTRSSPELDDAAMAICSSLFPGGGQFYKGEHLKGLLFLSGAFFFSEWDYRKDKTAAKVGLTALYAASLADVTWTIIKE
jgi:hypothetical protein